MSSEFKVFNVLNKPNKFEYPYEKCSRIDQDELDKLGEKGISIFIYWYWEGEYEGSGNAIYKFDGKWYVANLGHCSCYGPLDEQNIDFKQPYYTLDEIEKNSSEHYFTEVRHLIEFAKMNLSKEELNE